MTNIFKDYKIAVFIGAGTPIAICLFIAAIFIHGSRQTVAEINQTAQKAKSLPEIHSSKSNDELPIGCGLESDTLNVLHFAKYTYQPVQDTPFNYYLKVYASTQFNSDDFSPRIYKGEECEPVNSSISLPWSDNMPMEVAISLKKEWFEFLRNLNSELFQEMISIPNPDLHAPFYPEDEAALKKLNLSFGENIKIFEDGDAYLEYRAENDPFFIKDHPSLKQKSE